MNNRTLSPAGAAIIKDDEELRLTAYHGEKDPPGIWTICYGHTHGVYEGMVCTPGLCEWYFTQDMASAVNTVNKCVAVPLTQNQFDACVSLAENIGNGAFMRSTLVRVLNSGDYQGAALHFADWKFSDGAVDQGLVNRRAREATLFLTSDSPTGDT